MGSGKEDLGSGKEDLGSGGLGWDQEGWVWDKKIWVSASATTLQDAPGVATSSLCSAL